MDLDYYQIQVPTMMKLHFNIISCTNDICNLEMEHLSSHPLFSDKCLELQVSWSKNVMDERECLSQILIGANNIDFCVLQA